MHNLPLLALTLLGSSAGAVVDAKNSQSSPQASPDVAPVQSSLELKRQISDRSDDDGKTVIVTGNREHGKSRDNDVVVGSSRVFGLDDQSSPINIRFTASYAQDVARCALNDSPSRLRAVVDGAPNSSPQVYAQDWIVRNNITCSVGANLLTISPPDLGRSIYQRTALISEVLAKYAPDLKITKEQTADPETVRRFEDREAPRNKFRQLVDQRYFKAVVCMVQLNPEASVQLAKDGLTKAQSDRARSAIIISGKICVGGARRVYVDSTQFRSYVVDAVYRWALASLAMATLIPN